MKHTDQRTESLLAWYRASPSPPPEHLPLRQDVWEMLSEMATLHGRTESSVLAELLGVHTHGWLRWEALSADQESGSGCGSAGATASQIEDMGIWVRAAGEYVPEYLDQLLRDSLLGALGGSGEEELREADWRRDDAALKIWMPERIAVAVRAMAERRAVSASDVVRNLLLNYLVGRLGYARAVIQGLWIEYRRNPSAIPEILFSRRRVDVRRPVRTQRILEHGKSAEGFKLNCPQRMKLLLENLSHLHGRSISEHCRNVLMAMVLK